MVNTGQPSNACFQCRTRKVKCDATRPQCEKCVKYGVRCPGYPDKSQVIFRDDTERVRERAFRKYEKRRIQSALTHLPEPQLQVPPEVTSSDSSESFVTTQTPKPAPGSSTSRSHSQVKQQLGPVAQVSRPGLVQGAVASFLTQWSVPDPDVFWGAFDAATNLYPSAPPNGCFRAALEAVALITLSLPPEAHRYDVRRSALKSYSIALKSITKALDDPAQRLVDHTFMSVFFVCIFESLAGMDHIPPRFLIHMLGMMSMIKLRGAKQFGHETGRRLFLGAYFLWNMGTIPLVDPTLPPLPEDICDVLLHTPHLGKHEASYRILPLADRGVLLRRSLLFTLRSRKGPPSEADLRKFIADGDALDKDLLAWYSGLPGHWPKRDPLYQLLTLNMFRAHRLFINDLRIRCYHRLVTTTGDSFHDEIGKNVRSARAIVDEICAEIPYAFGDDHPNSRKEDVEQAVVPPAEVDIFYHMSFSMVECLPEKQKQGIEIARQACGKASGLQKPFREFPILIQEEPDENAVMPCGCARRHYHDTCRHAPDEGANEPYPIWQTLDAISTAPHGRLQPEAAWEIK